jgi:exosome complex component MTR3
MDRKRVNGPEASVSPIFKKTEDALPIINSEKKRLDQRGAEDIRPICKHPDSFTFDIGAHSVL